VDDLVNSLGSPASGAFGKLSQGKKNAVMNIIKNLNTSEASKLANASGGTMASDLLSCAHIQNIDVVKSPLRETREQVLSPRFGG